MNKRISALFLAIIIITCLGAVLPSGLVSAQSVGDQKNSSRISSGGGTAAIKNDGTVWAWGANSGYPGGHSAAWEIPVEMEGLTDVVSVAAGSTHFIALKSDGTLWAWGHNYQGQLGDGTTTNSVMPVPVEGLTDVISVSGGAYYSVALKKDGSVWAWGSNTQSWLVADDPNDRISTPVQVKGLDNVITLSAGGSHVIALKEDGTVWAWGSNTSYQLGIEGIYQVREPLQINGLTDVRLVVAGGMHTVALRNDGTVWAWGSNIYGQLGDGTTYQQRGTPAQIEGLTNVVSVSLGGDFTIALKSDGTVWACGTNEYGQLGDGAPAICTTPVQVSGLSDVVAVSAARSNIAALGKDGTVWSQGRNMYGYLGDGTTNDSSTPVKTLIELGPQPDRPIITTPSQPSSAQAKPVVQAQPMSSTVLINGKKVDFEAYSISGNTYFKLRDLAAALNGSEVQFEVTWDGTKNAINLLSDHPYPAMGGGEPSTSGNAATKTSYLTTSAIYLDGKQVSLTAYSISDNNYFKLRDIGTALNFGVEWDGSANAIKIDTTR